MNGFENVEIVDDSNLELIMGGGEAADNKNQQKNQKSDKKDDTVASNKNAPASSKKDFNTAFSGNDDEDEDENENEDIEDVEDNEDEAGEGKNKKTKDEEDIEDEGSDDKNSGSGEDVNAFIKARVEFLIKNGEWLDFDDRDKVEWDEETFGEYELAQRAAWRERTQEELLESFGPYGKQISEYSQNGGDPDKLLDLFKEQQRIDNWDISTEEGQKQLVYKYETETLKRSAQRVQKNIERLIADKELEEEAKDIKKTLGEQLEEEQENLQTAQKTFIKEQQRLQDEKLVKFSTDVTSTLEKRKDISDTEKTAIKKLLTVFKKTPNGPVNGFAERFIEFRKNLDNYIDLVRLVNNPKAFKKATGTQAANAVAEKNFSLIRTNNLTKKSGSKTDDNRTTKKSGSKFRLI